MLYRVEVENFYSIREPQVIDLRVAANVPDIPGRFAPVWPGAEERVPKSIAIFGANASGKSTLLKIVAFLVDFLLRSFAAPPTQRMMFDRFNNVEAFGQPTRFAVELSSLVDLAGPNDPGAPMCRYRYELEIGGAANELARVIREALFYWPERNGNGPLKEGEIIQQGYVTPPDKPGLGVEMNEEEARKVQIPGTTWFEPNKG